jgi:hypothetical protein
MYLILKVIRRYAKQKLIIGAAQIQAFVLVRNYYVNFSILLYYIYAESYINNFLIRLSDLRILKSFY